MTNKRFIEIRLPKCVLYLTPEEIHGLLKHDQALWIEALKRGKAFTRASNRKAQEARKFAEYEAERFDEKS